MRLIWSPQARQTLIDICDYLAGQNADPAATDLIDRIRARARSLLMAPRAGRKVQPENRDDLRVIPERPYWLYYRITPNAIEVAAVVHFRQLPTTRP